MKMPVVIATYCTMDRFLSKILRRSGGYFQSENLFFHELWKQRLINIGFRVLYVEKLPYHDVWDIRVCGSLSAQTYLLVSKPVPKKLIGIPDLVPKQLRSEIRQIGQDLGCPIKRDCMTVVRSGAYFRASFIWPLGKPGRLLKQEKKAEAFSFLIQPWLRRNRN